MQITKFSDYALRVLIHLAVETDRLIGAREISERHRISFNHLAKVTQWLAAEGLVSSTRGRSGGMQLAKHPDEISIGAVLRRSEASTALVECQREDGGTCALSPACGLKPILGEAQEAFYQTLDRKTLADVLARDRRVAPLVRSLPA